MEIQIISAQITSRELKKQLEIAPNVEVEYQLQPRPLGLRNIDPTILVAIISTAGTSLIALLTTILSIAKEKQLSKIVIQSKDGTKIEIPASYPVDKLDAIIQKIKEIESPKIMISR